MRLRRGHVVFVIIVTEDNDSFLCFCPLRVALVVTDGVFKVDDIRRFAAFGKNTPYGNTLTQTN